MILAHPWIEEEIDVFVEQRLVLLVSCTEVLQKLMCQLHDILHAHVFSLKVATAEVKAFYVIQHRDMQPAGYVTFS